MCAGCLVCDSLHRRVGDEVADEVEFGGASLLVAVGDRPDGAAVEVDPVVVVADCVGVGEVALGVEQFGQDGDPFVDRFALQLVFRVFDESTTASFEDSVHEFGVFFFDVFEELDREAAVS